jgi:hypothetical protein
MPRSSVSTPAAAGQDTETESAIQEALRVPPWASAQPRPEVVAVQRPLQWPRKPTTASATNSTQPAGLQLHRGRRRRTHPVMLGQAIVRDLPLQNLVSERRRRSMRVVRIAWTVAGACIAWTDPVSGCQPLSRQRHPTPDPARGTWRAVGQIVTRRVGQRLAKHSRLVPQDDAFEVGVPVLLHSDVDSSEV